MICNEFEYKAAVTQLEQDRRTIAVRRDQLQQTGLAEAHIDQMIGQLQSDCRQLEEDVATYERRTARTWRIPIE